MKRAFPVFLAFLAMGFADAAGPFVSLAREQFQLSYFAAQWITFSGFVMFGLLSIPMGLWQDRTGKKFILLLGLLIMLAGLLIPALFGFTTFAMFLLAVLLLGAGATTLQVAGNPIMRDVSPPGLYSRNLSLAQFVKAIGSLSGPVLPVIAARWFGASWQVVFPIYSAAVVLTILAVLPLKVEERRAPDQRPATLSSCLKLMGNGYVALMVFAIFFYVGAEVSVSAGIPLYLKDRFGIDISRTGLLGTGLFFLALTLGRFSGGVILNWMKPKTFFLITCLVSIAGLLGILVPSPAVSAACFFVAGLGFANIFPLVFSITVDAMPEHVNALSGLMVTAIVGAAFVPPLMGYVSDLFSSAQAGFLVPLGAILYVAAAALANLRRA
ncbi:MAG: MFS transporter [Bryobacteraceae bacterium]|nr:MFS transporter [Bryobacteraceae bacterium]